jgi:D-threonate/D-erythronate kinase
MAIPLYRSPDVIFLSVPRPELTCLILADDLTGACDSAVHFAQKGCETAVWLGLPEAQAEAPRHSDALAVSTESRALPSALLPAIFADSAARLPRARLVFKKIDSTLRGNVGAEVALAAKAFGCESAVITPAFPAMGRTVEDGSLLSTAAAPVEMAPYWRAQRLPECVHMHLSCLPDALAAGVRFASLDAASDADLAAIAAAGLASDRRILWVGSGGLAAALARTLGPGASARPAPPASAAALFCIGSTHAATAAEERRLIEQRAAFTANAETAEPSEIAAALAGGRHVALRIPCGRMAPEQLTHLLAATRAPLAATGGFTASLLWRALGVEELHLRAEISPGIPLGVIHGGVRDGAALATKSGGFGGPDALIEIADYFLPL